MLYGLRPHQHPWYRGTGEEWYMMAQPKEFTYPEGARDACAHYLLELCTHSRSYSWGLVKGGPPGWLIELWGVDEWI